MVSASLSVAALLLLYLGELAGQIVANLDLAWLIRILSLPGHYTGSFSAGLVRFEDIIYFAGLITIALCDAANGGSAAVL